MMKNEDHHQQCGFVSVIGLPNAGKSTIINHIVGSKISIVTHKVQTTRQRVLGMVVHDNTQLILIDTPGIFEAKKPLEKAMVDAAISSLSDGNMIAHIVDVTKKHPLESNKHILKLFNGFEKKAVLVFNKIDKIEKSALLDLTQSFNAAFDYSATFMVSALKGAGMKDFTKHLASTLPAGPFLYPEDQMSDMPLRLMAAEVTREKIFELLHQELPYSIFVETEKWENFKDGSVKIDQIVYVEKDSQKGIVLGNAGQRIKEIGRRSRTELSAFLDQDVHLKIFVKVHPKWSEKPETFRQFGLETS